MKCPPCQQGLHDMCNGTAFCNCDCQSAGETELTDHANASETIRKSTSLPSKPSREIRPEIYRWRDGYWKKTLTFIDHRHAKSTETIVRDSNWNFVKIERSNNAKSQRERQQRIRISKSQLP